MKKAKYFVVIWDGKEVYCIESASRNARKYLREYNAKEVSVYTNGDKGANCVPVSFAELKAVSGRRVVMFGAVK